MVESEDGEESEMIKGQEMCRDDLGAKKLPRFPPCISFRFRMTIQELLLQRMDK